MHRVTDRRIAADVSISVTICGAVYHPSGRRNLVNSAARLRNLSLALVGNPCHVGAAIVVTRVSNPCERFRYLKEPLLTQMLNSRLLPLVVLSGTILAAA